MSTWDDITGKSAAKKAKQYQQQAEAYQNSANNLLETNLGRLLKSSNLTESQISNLISQIYPRLLSGNAISDEATQLALDHLLGKETSEEQQRADLLAQNYIDQLTGAKKTDEQNMADQWGDKYINLLQGSPDIAFNAGVTELARNMASQKQAVSNAIQSRGIAGSGIDLDRIAGTEADYYRGKSQLQANRVNNLINNAALGADYYQGRSDRQQKNYGLAVDMAGNMADKKLNNLYIGANLANSNSQQNLANLLGLFNARTNAAALPNSAYSQLYGGYNASANNAAQTANSYSQQASSAAGALGGLAGTLIGGLINPIGAAIGSKIGQKIGGK